MKRLIIIIACFLFINCDINREVKFDYNLFLTQKKAWEQFKPYNYQYNFFRNNHGFEPEMSALIIVENGQYKDQIPDEGEWLIGVSTEYQTIDKIYETIDAIFNFHRNNKDDSVYLTEILIEYDLENHIPIKTEFFYYVEHGVMDVGNYGLYRIKNYKSN
jgi:hypothetical protein